MYNKKAAWYYERGRALHQKGKLSDSERAYKKAISISREFVPAYNNLGNVLLDRGRLKQATDTYRKALDLSPDHPMLLNNLGNALQLQGENKKALRWLNKAITKNPNYADAYNNLGNALSELGKFSFGFYLIFSHGFSWFGMTGFILNAVMAYFVFSLMMTCYFYKSELVPSILVILKPITIAVVDPGHV